jgi:thioredoxin reductase/Pyruvate/2-oxoacid:ferredoxin oxidoreductase delta subunit
MGMLVNAGFAALLVLALWLQLRRFRRREMQAHAAAAHARGIEAAPRAQHPRIDASRCIGCGACVHACPEGDVLGVVVGKAALVNPQRCIGHGLCADACPVGAIEIVMAPPSVSADTPQLTPQLETTMPGLFVAGELGGLALIKNAVAQGRACIDTVAARLGARAGAKNGIVDVCIVGAGPAGLSASLRAHECGLSYVTIEQEELGGSVAKFPRQKLVLTSPFELPIYGAFRKLEVTKEALLALWTKVARETRLSLRTGERVEQIRRDGDQGTFTVETSQGSHRARCVVLAIGRRGSPRKLGIPGEERVNVMYHLLDAEAYRDKRILIVGGGDSAVEAALGLAHQRGNKVTLSYRRDAFSRLKKRNEDRVAQAIRRRQVDVAFSSSPVEVRAGSVTLEVRGGRKEIPNDYVWIFAGGTPPAEFLERIGVAMGVHAVA